MQCISGFWGVQFLLIRPFPPIGLDRAFTEAGETGALCEEITKCITHNRHEISLRISTDFEIPGGGGISCFFLFFLENLTLECIKTAVY